MASAQSSSSTVRAGLVYQAVGLNEHLKVALGEAGVNVVLECVADKIVIDLIRSSNLDVFVVNLDPQLEDHLDELTEMLDQMQRPVIFNDAAASSSLGGWDQARWARHLAAKIKGELDSNPPRPANAAAIPMPVRAPVAPVAPVKSAPVKPTETAHVAPIAAVAAVAPVVAATRNEELASKGSDFDEVFSELEFNFEATDASAPAMTQAPPQFDEEVDGLADFDASAFDLPEMPAENFAASELTDFDALFRSEPESKAESKSAARESSRTDAASKKAGFSGSDPIEMDFSALSLDFAPTDVPLSTPMPTPTPPKKAPVSSELKDAPISWSLEPLDGEVPAAVPTGRAVYKAKDVEPPPPVVVPPKAAPAKAAPAPVENELGDFDFFSDLNFADPAPPVASPAPTVSPVVSPAASSPAPVAPSVGSGAAITKKLPVVKPPESSGNDFDSLFADLESLSDMAVDTSPTPKSDNFSGGEFGGDSLDFDMDFEVGMAAPASNENPVANSSAQSEFADLDALFADPPAQTGTRASGSAGARAPTQGIGPDRVFVLGASIGGPEAVRSFLSKLKPKTPAAFVLAQHMGAEFLELMTSQLAKASALPVRLAKPGEKFSAGEIVVVPVNQRFVIDDSSHIQFAALPTESPYSPSIDQVMMDMADRFGSRCTGIIFSGMASDAIEGAKYLASRGAKVWVQDPATCVISSMIDGAQAAGVVSFVGAPEQLADHVLDDLGVMH